MAQPNPVPRNNEAETLGTSAKRWLTTFTKNIGDGTILHAIADIVTAAGSFTLTNKIIDSDTNTVRANKIHTAPATTPVTVSGVPAVNAVLSADSATAASWKVGGDNQQYDNITAFSTTSTSYVDITGMTLTTAATYTRSYLIFASVSHHNTNADKIHSFQLLIDGVVVREWTDQSNKAAVDQSLTMPWLATIPPGKIVKLQAKTSANTMTINKSTLIIRGIL